MSERLIEPDFVSPIMNLDSICGEKESFLTFCGRRQGLINSMESKFKLRRLDTNKLGWTADGIWVRDGFIPCAKYSYFNIIAKTMRDNVMRMKAETF